jgi:hypothetical protein
MAEQKSGTNPKYLKYAKEFAKGILKGEKYLETCIKKNRKMVEMRDLAKDPYLFHLYISKAPYYVRPRAIKEVHNLSNKSIRNMRNKAGFQGTIDNIMRMEFNIYSVSTHFHELAIILDTPIDYLTLENPISQQGDPNSFYEYLKVNNISTFDQITTEVIERPIERFIDGYCVVGSSKLFKHYEFIRIDKHVEFFSLELFFPSLIFFNDVLIQEILNKLGSHVHTIFLSKAFLRDVYKISVIGLYDDNQIHKEFLESSLSEIAKRLNAIAIYPN